MCGHGRYGAFFGENGQVGGHVRFLAILWLGVWSYGQYGQWSKNGWAKNWAHIRDISGNYCGHVRKYVVTQMVM